jgi:hypothetical protein
MLLTAAELAGAVDEVFGLTGIVIARKTCLEPLGHGFDGGVGSPG